ncbi:nitroreductase family protein [candidate division KSB1 bacterium]|nr:nitroreductase family protein [candidate division KSB1 bacterium]
MTDISAFQHLVQTRRSIRRYIDKPVEREKILACIDAARLAPSAENLQPWRFIVIDDPQVKADFCDAAFSGIYRMSRWACKAPIIVAMLVEMDVLVNRLGKQVQGTQYYLLDSGIAGEHFVLQAHELQLGTCWIGWFNAKKARKFFGLSKKYRAVALFSMGYYDSLPGRQRRLLDREAIVAFNGWQNGERVD